MFTWAKQDSTECYGNINLLIWLKPVLSQADSRFAGSALSYAKRITVTIETLFNSTLQEHCQIYNLLQRKLYGTLSNYDNYIGC